MNSSQAEAKVKRAIEEYLQCYNEASEILKELQALEKRVQKNASVAEGVMEKIEDFYTAWLDAKEEEDESFDRWVGGDVTDCLEELGYEVGDELDLDQSPAKILDSAARTKTADKVWKCVTRGH